MKWVKLLKGTQNTHPSQRKSSIIIAILSSSITRLLTAEAFLPLHLYTQLSSSNWE